MRSSDCEGRYSHRWQLHRRRHCSASDIPRTHCSPRGSYSLRSHNASTTLSSFSRLIDGGTLPYTPPVYNAVERDHGSTSRITNDHPRTNVETVLLRIIRDPNFFLDPRCSPISWANFSKFSTRRCENCQFFYIPFLLTSHDFIKLPIVIATVEFNLPSKSRTCHTTTFLE